MRLGIALASALVAGCGAGGSSGPAEPAAGQCSVQLSATPPMPEPLPFEPPSSRLVVVAGAEVRAIQRELEKRIPVVLDTARRRPVGAPGLVTYTVKRGPFDVRVDGSRIVVSTPVNASISVCKPLGPFCPTYGRCNPRFVAEVSVPFELTNDYDIGKSRAGMSTARRCVIAGFDATPEIERISRQQMGAIQARVDREIRPLRSDVSLGWRFLHVPVALDADTCFRARPRELVYGSPKLEDGDLKLALGADLTVAIEQPCAPDDPKPSPLPPPRRVDDLGDGIDVQVPVVVGWERVTADLSRSLEGKKVGSASIVKVTAHPGGKHPLVLEVGLSGEVCGSVWVEADVEWVREQSRLRPRAVALLPGQSSEIDLDQLEAVLSAGRMSLPVDAAQAHEQLEARVAELARELPDELLAEVVVEPARVDQVKSSKDGLIPILHLVGQATVVGT